MQPTDAMIADVLLNVPKALEKTVLTLNEGDSVVFEG